MKRYIGGATLPEEVLSDLERHLHACPDCLSEAQRMKDALLAGKEMDAPVATTSPMAKVKGMLAPLFSKLPGQKAVAPREGLITSPGTPLFTESRVNMRVLATSAALALTLIAMSTILRDPTRLLGSKVSATANTPPAVTEEQKEEEETTTEEHGEEEADSHAEDETADSEHEKDATDPETENLDDELKPEHSEPDAATHGTTPTPAGPAHGASGTGQSPRSPSHTNGGLSLPGRPTMGDSPIITADSRNGISGSSTPPRPAAQPQPRRTPPRASTPRRRTGTTRPSNSSTTPRSPVTVYNPDGTKK